MKLIVNFLILCTLTFAQYQRTNRQIRCNMMTGLCPQTCLATVGGCTYCNSLCLQIVGKNINGQQGPTGGGTLAQSGSVLSYGGSNSGLSLMNPASMTSFNSLQNLGNVQTSVANSGSGGFNVLSGYNPSNMGPINPFVNSGSSSNPGNPVGAFNPSNLGTLLGSVVNPSNPGAAYIGQVGVTIGNTNGGGSTSNTGMTSQNGPQAPSSSGNFSGSQTPVATQTCAPLRCPSSSKIQLVNGCPICISSPSTTKSPRTTTQVPLVTLAPARHTCAPLRCVAPCDKGITIGHDGCPKCICK